MDHILLDLALFRSGCSQVSFVDHLVAMDYVAAKKLFTGQHECSSMSFTTRMFRVFVGFRAIRACPRPEQD
jgi:hypothetical protein